jgi:hypothetical protein
VLVVTKPDRLARSTRNLRLTSATWANDDPEVPDVPVPPGPEPHEPDENKTLASPTNELENRLLRQRKVLVFGAIDDKVARRDRLAARPRARPTANRSLRELTWRPRGEWRHDS